MPDLTRTANSTQDDHSAFSPQAAEAKDTSPPAVDAALVGLGDGMTHLHQRIKQPHHLAQPLRPLTTATSTWRNNMTVKKGKASTTYIIQPYMSIPGLNLWIESLRSNLPTLVSPSLT
jgi:hypothetical protein